jgi:hypothetical protein
MRHLMSVVEKIPFAPAAILAAKTVIDSRYRGPTSRIPNGEVAEWCATVRRVGACVVEKFIPGEKCAQLIAEIDSLMAAYPQAVQVDTQGADQRLFLGNPQPLEIAEVCDDHRLSLCAATFLGDGAVNLAVLAGRLNAAHGNGGSGGGWHRDSFTNQFKAIIYLSDVGQDNGPFQYVQGSHRLTSMIRDQRRAALGVAQHRVRDDQIQRLIEGAPDRLLTLVGRAGTLILADTTGLHRGMPITTGTRHALTNYYFAPRTITPVLRDRFKPILGLHVPYKRAASSSIDSI